MVEFRWIVQRIVNGDDVNLRVYFCIHNLQFPTLVLLSLWHSFLYYLNWS
jgi:hypothetical protein